MLEHLGDASTAIANLEASEATDEDKSKLLPNLQELIAAELGDVVEPSED